MSVFTDRGEFACSFTYRSHNSC